MVLKLERHCQKVDRVETGDGCGSCDVGDVSKK